MDPPEPSVDEFLRGGGEAGALMRAMDWSQSPLGPVASWSQSLRTVVRLMLDSRFAMRVLWGPEFIFLYNDGYRPVLGATKHPGAMGSRTAESFREVWHIVGPMFHRVRAGEAVALDDTLLPLDRNGFREECYFTLSYSPIRDERGEVDGVLGVVYETTARVLAERRLGTLRDLAAAAAEATTAEEACARAAAALARNAADVPYAAFYLTDGDGPPRLVHAMGEGPPRRAVVLPLTRPGRERPDGFLVAGVSDRLALDDRYRDFFELAARHVATGLANAAAHVDERRRAEALAAAAEAERARLYEVFMQAPMPVSIFRGDDFVLELANPAALRAWGKTVDIVGRPLLEGFPELPGQGFDDRLRRVVATGEPFRGAEVLARLDRGHGGLDDAYFNIVYTPLRERDGSIEAVLVCSFEVTEQVRARRGAESLAAELTRQKEALEDAHRVKDEFLATMSHELRTPLNAILGWTRMVRSGRVTGERREHALETIERNAAAQTRLIEDLLDVSRIMSGKLRLAVAPVDLSAVVTSAIDTMRPAAEARNILVHAVVDSHAGPVMGDADRLGQVVSNLLSNALKFTPKGGRVQLVLERVDSALRLTVTDSGAGIAPEFLPHVFERFRQGDQSITRRHGGIGVGLSIVKHLVELHGGTITAESAGEGCGATFVVSIPVSALRHGSRPTPGHEPAGVGLPATLAGLRVLVVDDEEDARELMGEMLALAGAEVRRAATAAEALEVVKRFRPQVLVSDVGMPDADGYSLIERVRALPAADGGRTPAAAVTAYARGEDRRRALTAGFNLHLAKPIDPSEFLAAVASLADRHAAR